MGRGSAAASCTARGLHASVAEPSRLVKVAWEDGPEMKHIPLTLGFCLQKRKVHLHWCKTLQLLPCHSHEEQSLQAAFLVRQGMCWCQGQGDTGAVLFPGRSDMQSDGDPILCFWPRVTLTSPWPEGWGRPMAKALQQECLNTHQGRH